MSISLRLFFKKWGCFMKAIEIANWFVFKNPSILKGGNDENLKLNTLLYCSNLMYLSVFEKKLIDDKFENFEGYPVVKSIYDEYQYNNLCESADEKPTILDKKILQILEINNFVNADLTLSELNDMCNKLKILTLVENKGMIDNENIPQDLKEFMVNLYNLYKNYDFDNIEVVIVNGNKYIYFKDELEITEDIMNQLKAIEKQNTTNFIEMIDGELVFS